MPISENENNSNSAKWKGMFVPALRKVQSQVHPSLKVQDDALEYIESLIIQLLNHLCACQPRSVADVEERVNSTFPHPIDKWAIGDAQAAIEKGKKKSVVVLPADKVHPLIVKDILGFKVEFQVSLYIVAVMEYISADILKLAGNYVKNIRHVEITCQDIKVALFADKVLMDMFHPDEVETSVETETLISQAALTYDEVVHEMMHAEGQFIRELNMIIKVFRAPFVDAKELFTSDDIDRIFSNILDIYEFSVTFLGLLDAAVEVVDEGKQPAIGECFEEMAEGARFEVYDTYAREQTASVSKQYRHLGIGGKLSELLLRTPVSDYFKSIGPHFKEAVQYCLPKLLMMPVYHCLHYFDLIKLLIKTSPDEADIDSLAQAQSALGQLEANMEKIVQASGSLSKRREDNFSRAQKRKSGAFRSAAVIMNELQKNIDGWEGRDISQSCTEIMKEGTLGKVHLNKRGTERYVFLLDGLLICCKQNTRHSLTGPTPEYRLKEKYYLRKIEINDLDDTEDVKNAFEIVDREQAKAIFTCKTEEDKNEWMAGLMTIYMRSTLDRMLDHLLSEEEKAIPLRMPSPEEYCFAVEDAEDNIVFEEGQGSSSNAPVIKGGTLIKLIERLTHHKYADPTFVRTFLTTYRSFCKPTELLDYLIQRFDITEPPPSEEDKLAMARGEPVVREDLKRFRKEYAQPVQLRVLNVLRHWVDNHCYDFERDAELLKKLNLFLEGVKGKAMRRWVESINKVILRKTTSSNENLPPEITFEREPPPIEWHLAVCHDCDMFNILTLHPIEIARQLTLIESELYRAVRPSELVGSVWTKEDIKHLTSPNLLKMIHHTNKITLWFEKSMLEFPNLEERVAVLSRIIDILTVFQELNNFNGILEVVSAINSSPVYRLQHTFAELSAKRNQTLEEAKELSQDHYKKYIEKLRSINPPCVPFFGMYLTNILKTEEGNPDFLHNYPPGIINFSKRRKVAEITGEIQQYQNQPYCLQKEHSIAEYLETLDPFEGRSDSEIEDYLYQLSLDIEPRNCERLVKHPRKTDYSLKSPGTKPTYLQSRLSIATQSTLRRSPSQASSVFLPDSEWFPSSLSLSPSTPRTFSSMSSFPLPETVPETPIQENLEPDYVNIENFPENEPSPPVLPPRKQRAATVNGPEGFTENATSPVRRQISLNSQSPPLLPPKAVTLERFSPLAQRDITAPPIPPREPNRGVRRMPPPVPPRLLTDQEPPASPTEVTNHDDCVPPARPPKKGRS
ncbi:son of sevenless homolog 1-like [Acropora millepora]|uniref:son of sevenless homolog 1-like n=1 Tax=Acropora millepora TaxID=45264 RepID=UPI001CF5F400|nr:son of sevenless homolog 1-like [Acropora millepora]